MQNIRNFAILAHIDHGKSTLADRFLELTGTVEKRKMHEQFLDQMELERERGITIKLQPVRMNYTLNANRYTLNLIDTPGHVDFSYEVSRSLAAVEGAILLVDATKGVQAQTLANLHLAQKSRFSPNQNDLVENRGSSILQAKSGQGLVIIPVINKIDLTNAQIAEVEEEIKNLLLSSSHDRDKMKGYENEDELEVLKISAKTGENVEQVLEAVVAKIPPPNSKFQIPNSRFHALIFDSAFDTYKGVIAYVRVFDGSIKAGEKIKLFASGASSDVVEVGYFMPQLKKEAILSAGEIGYIATGLKNPGQVRVGDTLTNADQRGLNTRINADNLRESALYQRKSALARFEPLPGYEEPKPMVFASFYPENSDDYDVLKDALGKLKLTDASLIYEPESSPALGRGFRLGFLGMLHIEIISERLRREFGLALIVSTPSVEYHVATKRGEILKIRSAAALPDPSMIEKIEEPVVDLEILSPVSYMGQLMKLMAELRSQYKSTDYLSKEVAVLKYTVPLSEIITDFYDRLKSVSSGYASMSYSPAQISETETWAGKPSGYQVYDLVRLDILVAEEKIEPFSKIVPREQAYHEGRRIVEKLKKILPRQWFAVSLQAAIGGKIIARETIPALRKDVTGYLYGGDVTRKKKLLEKQKRGKAKMKERGRVEIPQGVFLEMLKK